MNSSHSNINNPLLPIIEEADLEKNFHQVILSPASQAYDMLLDTTAEYELDVRNIPHCYKYGLLIFVGEEHIMSANYYAEKIDELQSGVVIVLNSEANELSHFKKHKL